VGGFGWHLKRASPICSRSSLSVEPPTALFAMLIKVKTLTGKEIEIDIEKSDKISRIKERVEENSGVPPPQQMLIFGGRQMADEKSAEEYNIEGGSVLHLILKLH